MMEIQVTDPKKAPQILVIGVGGGGNNALDRMIDSNLAGVHYAAVNTDIQVLDSCKAQTKIQIGLKLTKGYGAGADSDIGEAAAIESEEAIKNAVQGYDLCIITCGMGGGTGTGAAPIIAQYCKEVDILTVGVVTTPFSFENTPRIATAARGVERMKENVDTLLCIPNDKLIGLSDKPLLLEDAFAIADSVLKYTIEGITNIIYNKGIVNLDFNDLRTTLSGKGIGHLGIGIVDEDQSVLEATKLAINSPLLDTSIQGATNLLINTCGKVNIVSLNEAIGYVKEQAGDKVNIIWGTVSGTDHDMNKIVVTLIATGMMDTKSKHTPQEKVIQRPPILEPSEFKTKALKTPAKEVELRIPPFLTETYRKEKRSY